MSVPMGAGMFFTRHADTLERTFAIDTQYMPVTKGVRVIEPHLNSMQWSRRFIGLKVFLSLAVAGWDGYADAIQRQCDMGDVLREKLVAAGWRVVNETALPTVCFVDATVQDNDLERLRSICAAIVDPGRAWISTTRMGGAVPVLRACITNYRTGREDIDQLVSDLGNARERVNDG
jgi:glutamate/tyrosine decarboxylase-like PLP-dependent enzyme